MPASRPKRKLKLVNEEFTPGDPSVHVLGRPDEQPARRHAPLPRKPTVKARPIDFPAYMLVELQERMRELEPLIEEYKVLQKWLEILEDR